MTDKPGRAAVVKCRRPGCTNASHPVYGTLCEDHWNDAHRMVPGHSPTSRTPHSVKATRKLPQEFGG